MHERDGERERLRPMIKSNVNKSAEERQKRVKYFRRQSCRAVAGVFDTERALLHLAQLVDLHFPFHRLTRINVLRFGRLARSYDHLLIRDCKKKKIHSNRKRTDKSQAQKLGVTKTFVLKFSLLNLNVSILHPLNHLQQID